MLWPHSKGNGWSISKFHEQLHIPDDIDHNGDPSSTHTGPTEHHHISFIKNLAKWTQKWQDKLDQQIAEHYKESVIIDTAFTAVMFHQCNANTTDEAKITEPTSLCKMGNMIAYKINNNGNEEIEYNIQYNKSSKYNQTYSHKQSTNFFDDDDNIYNSFTNAMGEIDVLDWWQINDTTMSNDSILFRV